jgi:hypothetical protein
MAWANFTGTAEEVVKYLTENKIKVNDVASIFQDLIGHWHVFHNSTKE